ncbi:MAG: very short patch repair endonuclease [Planctomycetota bacterium]
MDVLTPKQRSYCMSRIRGKNTKPEIVVRKLAHSLGYRFRLHVEHLPGSPDLVFPRLKKIIFVHGCFWHRHRCKNGRATPRTRRRFWLRKLQQNKERDQKARRALRRLGWKILVIWECNTQDIGSLIEQLHSFLSM